MPSERLARSCSAYKAGASLSRRRWLILEQSFNAVCEEIQNHRQTHEKTQTYYYVENDLGHTEVLYHRNPSSASVQKMIVVTRHGFGHESVDICLIDLFAAKFPRHSTKDHEGVSIVTSQFNFDIRIFDAH